MKHIAVVGAGISGLAAAYLLSRRHRVSLFERAGRLGGHTHTILLDDEAAGRALPLDTGFLVYNDRTYPNLARLFREIGVDTQTSDMSFSVTCPATGLEYSSRGVGGFFAAPAAALQPAHYALLRDIVRFNRHAPRVLLDERAASWTLGDYLDAHRYSDWFVHRYLLPMTSAIWSSPIEGVRAFPAQMLVRFLHNHGMLGIGRHPTWRVVRGGSCSYVPRLTRPYARSIHVGVEPLSVRRGDQGVVLTFADRPAATFDEVVFACHGDQVLPLLSDATEAERDVFGHFTTTRNDVWLHRDARWLPRRRRARASWNYRLGAAPDAPPTVTYHLNRLQGLESPTDYCVTLNPGVPIADRTVIRRVVYEHPRYTLGVRRAQARWREVSGARRAHFCGAYWRYGFHEDGLLSAVRVARDLGVCW
jgi:predicted NAD/FAD-binding protein